MSGMHASTGRRLDGLDHLRQSIADILTTPIGSRVMRREYGSLVPELLGLPMNDVTLLRLYSACVMAILRWEPRVSVTAIRRMLLTSQPGALLLEIEGKTRDGENVRFEVPVR